VVAAAATGDADAGGEYQISKPKDQNEDGGLFIVT
jgi:hypothetical protein